jgi:hypothetical protein
MASDFGVSGRIHETKSVTAKPRVCHREAPRIEPLAVVRK